MAIKLFTGAVTAFLWAQCFLSRLSEAGVLLEILENMGRCKLCTSEASYAPDTLAYFKPICLSVRET